MFSNLVLVILISTFVFIGSFIRVLFVFNSIPQSKFMVYYFYEFGPHFFSFVKIVFIFYVNFDPHSFDIFLVILLN